MSPEDFAHSAERRLQRLEELMDNSRSDIQMLTGKVRNLEDVVHNLAPLTREVAVLARNFEVLDKDLGEARDAIHETQRFLSDRQERMLAELHHIEDRRRSEQKERDDAARKNRFAWASAAGLYATVLLMTIALLFQTLGH